MLMYQVGQFNSLYLTLSISFGSWMFWEVGSLPFFNVRIACTTRYFGETKVSKYFLLLKGGRSFTVLNNVYCLGKNKI